MNSEAKSENVINTWAKGVVDISAGFFILKDSSMQKFSDAIDGNSIRIQADFNQFVMLPGEPFRLKDGKLPELKEYYPWFEPAALKLAKENNNNKVWKRSSPSWESMFGTNGSLNHLIAGLVVVDGIHLTIKLNADIPKEERDEFAALVKEGSYPLFCAEGQGGWVNNFQLILYICLNNGKNNNLSIEYMLAQPSNSI